MSAGLKHKKYQLIVILLPYQKPVGSDMTFPGAVESAGKLVGTVLHRESTISCKNLYDSS